LLQDQGKMGEADKSLSQARKAAPEVTDKAALDAYFRQLPQKHIEGFKASMQAQSNRTADFLSNKSNFALIPQDGPGGVLFFLREWNSFTPIVPGEGESQRGGGYYLRYANQGIVIDPGHDFIEQLSLVRGRIVDIDHIIVSHAHSDHTAELEGIFTLLFEFNARHPKAKKRVCLYLSQDAYIKFSGLLGQWADSVARTTVLNPGAQGEQFQTVTVCEGVSLTVLPAQHEDMVTQGNAVGLGVELRFGRSKRRLLFTCDTSYLKGGKPVWELYPKSFRKPDLLVAHLGSIHPKEFEFLEAQRDGSTGGDYKDFLYPNHLGLFGTCLLVRALGPSCAVVSEFGEEMKDTRIPLVDTLGKVLQDSCPVYCGDPTIVYRVSDGCFLCHQTCTFEDPKNLEMEASHAGGGPSRPYLVKKADTHYANDVETWVEAFRKKLADCDLPFLRRPESTYTSHISGGHIP